MMLVIKEFITWNIFQINSLTIEGFIIYTYDKWITILISARENNGVSDEDIQKMFEHFGEALKVRVRRFKYIKQ